MKVVAKYTVICLVFIASVMSGGCSHETKNRVVVPRDTTITDKNAFSPLQFDSSRLQLYIYHAAIPDSTAGFLFNFYRSRNYHFAWFTNEGLADQAHAFWNLYKDYLSYSRDSSLVNNQFHQQMLQVTDGDTSFTTVSETSLQLELQLTRLFYKYAHNAYGGRVDPWELQWHIPRKKIDALALLDTIFAHEGKNLEELEPLNAAYKLLKNELLRYYLIEKEGGWEKISMARKQYKRGDSAGFIAKIKLRLLATGDYAGKDTSGVFNRALVKAVKKAQKRFGLRADGIIRENLVNELNVPVKSRIGQMLINLERMRWLPKVQAGNRIVANIPEFKLHVFENGKQVFDMDIVVGQAGNRTVVFTDKLKYIVFSPYWNIPRSIVRNEILPGMERDSNYLAKKNMEQTGIRNGLPVIRQRPGSGNALGRVKFLFPNNYSIYFHDTPAKSLFREQKRAFSHGCVRLARPRKLAEYLLREDSTWTTTRIRQAMYAGKEKWVTLAEPVPVALFYFTAWVDNEGMLNFREDIYGHDKRMAEHLFGHYGNQL